MPIILIYIIPFFDIIQTFPTVKSRQEYATAFIIVVKNQNVFLYYYSLPETSFVNLEYKNSISPYLLFSSSSNFSSPSIYSTLLSAFSSNSIMP